MAENNHNSDDLRAIRRGILAAVQSEGTPGKLGRRDGQLAFTDATGTTYRDRVWVTLDGAKGEAEIVAINHVVPRSYNLPVRVAVRDGVHTIIGIDGPYTAQYSGGRPVATAEHAWMHSRPGADPLYVSGLQVLPLMATPTTPPGMAVTVTRAQYRYGGALKLFDTGDSPGLSAYIPADDSVQHFVIICLDRENNALVVVDGADSSAGGDVYQQTGAYNQPFTAADVAAISIPDAYYPICAIRFYYGMTRILAPDIFMDCRLWAGERGGLSADDVTSGTLALERGGTEANLGTAGPGFVQQRTAGAALSVVLCQFDGTAAPGVGDDEGDGYSVGSRWFDITSDKEYVCLDASTGAAVWIETTGGGGTALTIEEIDGTPSVANVDTIRITNGTLTDDGNGQVTLDFGSAATDGSAIHDNVAGEIAAITEKASPASADLLLIEDSADSNNKKRVQIGSLPGGSGGAPTSAAYVTTASNGTLSAEIVIPGLAGSTDIVGIGGGGIDEEYDTSTTGLTWTPSTPLAVDSNTTRRSHLYVGLAAGTTEYAGLRAWSPAGAFDARAHLSIGFSTTNASNEFDLLIANSDNTRRAMVQLVRVGINAYHWNGSAWTQVGTDSSVRPAQAYARITRDSSNTFSFFWSADGYAWRSLGTVVLTWTVAQIGYRAYSGTGVTATGWSDWLRTNV